MFHFWILITIYCQDAKIKICFSILFQVSSKGSLAPDWKCITLRACKTTWEFAGKMSLNSFLKTHFSDRKQQGRREKVSFLQGLLKPLLAVLFILESFLSQFHPFLFHYKCKNLLRLQRVIKHWGSQNLGPISITLHVWSLKVSRAIFSLVACFC